MSQSTSKLQVSDLDFDTIKQNLKTFLQSQSTFQDYNFEGSGLSVLLDILAYNTYYNSFYLNMVANEMFLDSADIRDSIVSHAKHIGYTPRSTHSSRAIVNITINPAPDTPATITIPKYTPFTTTMDDTTFSFLTESATIITPESGVYTAEDVSLIEGEVFQSTFVVDSSIPNQRFVIPNNTVDTSTLSVSVQTSETNTETETFTLFDDLNTLTPTSAVFFLQEVENRKYEVIFGDDILGKKLQDGNIVRITYLISSGELANGAGNGNTVSTKFTAASTIQGYSNITTTTVNAAFGGAERETVESIKFTAPKHYQMQGRAVTEDDYKTLLVNDYPNIQSLAVWGGETNIPPMYGKVYISIKPSDGYELTAEEKNYITTQILNRRNIVSIIPEIIDPEYLYLTLTGTVRYNPSLTTASAESIRSYVISVIQNFATTQLDRFDAKFYYSKLLHTIDIADRSIVSNSLRLQLKRLFVPRLNVLDSYNIKYNNALTPNTFNSTAFTITSDPEITLSTADESYYLDDFPGSGSIRIYKIVDSLKVSVKESVGTIDYSTGDVTLSGIIPATIVTGTSLELTATPVIFDIVPQRNDIITINDQDIDISVVAD